MNLLQQRYFAQFMTMQVKVDISKAYGNPKRKLGIIKLRLVKLQFGKKNARHC